jgi:MFS family permease
MSAERPTRILPVIVLSQFAGTSLWFAGNAVLPDLQRELGLAGNAVASITSAVQLGFIAGTLVFAVLAIADRFLPSRVFLACALLGAIANALVIATPALAEPYPAILALRFATGFFLAGIYPVGMRIAAGWYREGLGNALGWLVGALVLGTAFPHC